jgi:hypothetical protein
LADDPARHRGGVDAVAAESARDPQPRRKLADLRHAMQRVAEHARPDVLDLHAGELRIELLDIGFEPWPVRAGITLPGGGAPGEQQPVTADHAIMVIGEVGISDGAPIGDRLGKPPPEWRGDDDIGPDRNQRAGDPRHQRAEVDVACEHDLARSHARLRRRDSLAHPLGVDRQRRRVLEDGTPAASPPSPPHIVERMD